MREERRFAAARGTEHDDVGFLDVRSVFVHVAVFHAFVVIVDGDGENLFGAVLIDDVFVEISLDDMRLVLFQDVVELVGEVLLFFFRVCIFVLFNEIVYVLDAVLADGKARVRVEDRHIVLVVDGDLALAEAACMFDGFLFGHVVPSFSMFVRSGKNDEGFL